MNDEVVFKLTKIETAALMLLLTIAGEAYFSGGAEGEGCEKLDRIPTEVIDGLMEKLTAVLNGID